MSQRPEHRFFLASSALTLAMSAAVYAVVGHAPWILALAAHLACLSALALVEAWRVRVASALLLCLGATTVVATTTTLLVAHDHGATSHASSTVEPDPQLPSHRRDFSRLSMVQRPWLPTYIRGLGAARRDYAAGIRRVYLITCDSWMWDHQWLAQHGVDIQEYGGCCGGCCGGNEYQEGYNDGMVLVMRDEFGAESMARVRHRRNRDSARAVPGT